MKWHRLNAVRTTVVTVSGFTSLVIGAATFNPSLGFAAAGASLLALAYLTDNTRGGRA